MLTMQKKYTLPLSLFISTSILSGCNSDDNKAPVLSGDAAPIVAENTTSVAQYIATDADNDQITYSIVGQDSAIFSIDSSGQLTFISAPDFDNGETGPYSVTVIATDDGKGSLTDELDITVTVGDVKDTPSLAVVQTVAPDYSNSEVVYINGRTEEIKSGYYIKDASDYTLASYKTDVYHIGRFFIDTITKFNGELVSERDNEIWSFSTQDAQDSISRNPYALISLDETKAYLLRYGSSKVWIVNPQATTIDDFKMGELDISSYVPTNNSKETPNPTAAVINDGKLYIVMQRLSDDWQPNTSYVAVFDTATDEEIETNANSDDSVKGIPLEGLNPLEHSITSGDDKVYISTRSAYSNTDITLSRIEEINPSDYSVRQVLNAGSIADNTSSFIKSSVILSAERGYFFVSQSVYEPSYHEVSEIFQFNPTTGAIIASNVANTGDERINFIDVDEANFLWVSVETPSAPGIDIINTETNEKVSARLPTELNPNAIRFIEK